MHKIFLTDKPEDLVLDVESPCLCVTHPKYAAPKMPVGTHHMGYKAFAADARSAVKDMKSLVLVGLDNMMNPGNRTDMVWEIVFNNTRALPRYVVNRLPFIGEPWRMWFAFGATSSTYLNYTYSYIAESHYNAWLEGYSDINPFDPETVLACSEGVVKSTYPAWYTDVKVDVVPVSPSVHEEYQILKDICFAEETSIKAIFMRLEKFAQSVCPTRSLPKLNKLHEHRQVHIVATDLKVDTYRVERLTHCIDLTNSILKATCK